jgi:sugar (pentulose or hexulose) kinase
MSGTPLIVGIDIGTSGARAVAMSGDFEIHANASAKLADYSADHRDPQVWWAAVQAALNGVLAEIDRGSVRALAIDGTSGTMLPVTATGEPLATPMMYNDPVDDAAILASIAGLAPRESAAHGATSGLAKLLMFQPIKGIHKVIHQADWLMGHFTGRYDTSDENNALKTGYDPVARRWPSWITSTDARIDFLPKVLPAGAPNGRISASAAALFGLPPETLVVAGTTDGCASFLATGADRAGDGVTALGTTMTVKLLSGKPLFAPQFGLYSHRIGDIWLAGGASNTGGVVLAEHFSSEQIRELSLRIDPETSTGLSYYPLVRPGERFPVNDPDLQPRMQPRPDDDTEFLKAIFEGIAAIEALAYNRLAELGGPALASIRTVGGGAANGKWAAIRERHLRIASLAVKSDEAAAGAARLALQGAKSAGLL